jgi:hypothetical protein
MVMRSSNSTRSIALGGGQEYCLVVDDLGRYGRVFREVDIETATFETVVTELLEGQYFNPVQVFSFNPDEGWSRDVSADVAAELRRRCDLQRAETPVGIEDFLERHEITGRQLSLRLR